MALAFLPILLVRCNFFLLEGSALVESTPRLKELTEYYQATWLDGSYPLRLWNVADKTIRTNNAVEGWHNKLNRGLGRHHPNIYQLIEYIQKEQQQGQQKVVQARLGVEPPPRRKKYRDLEERIEKIQQQRKDGIINAAEFLRRIRHVIHTF